MQEGANLELTKTDQMITSVQGSIRMLSCSLLSFDKSQKMKTAIAMPSNCCLLLSSMSSNIPYWLQIDRHTDQDCNSDHLLSTKVSLLFYNVILFCIPDCIFFVQKSTHDWM